MVQRNYGDSPLQYSTAFAVAALYGQLTLAITSRFTRRIFMLATNELDQAAAHYTAPNSSDLQCTLQTSSLTYRAVRCVSMKVQRRAQGRVAGRTAQNRIAAMPSIARWQVPPSRLLASGFILATRCMQAPARTMVTQQSSGAGTCWVSMLRRTYAFFSYRSFDRSHRPHNATIYYIQ